MLNVTYKQNFMLNVVMLSVVMLGIVAPVFFSIFLHFYFEITKIELHKAESSHLGRTYSCNSKRHHIFVHSV